MAEIDRNLGKRWFEEVWNKARREAIAEMMAPECVLHDGADAMRGPEGFYPFFDRIRATFPDLRVTVEDTIVEGDQLCVRWSCTATHTGDGLGIPPTHKQCRTTGISIVRAKDGMVIEGWQNWDMLGLLQQIQGAPKAPTYIVAE
jgi:steroid delta-isomerase-like uncharacterized protein